MRIYRVGDTFTDIGGYEHTVIKVVVYEKSESTDVYIYTTQFLDDDGNLQIDKFEDPIIRGVIWN